MNNVVLLGRLVRDPIARSGAGMGGDLEISRFTLAVDRRFKRKDDEQTADFISCVAFGKQAEFVNKYMHQGTKACLNGHIQTGSYTNRDGQKVYTTDVVVDNIEFAESKAASSGSNPDVGGGVDFSMDQSTDGFMNIPDGMQDEGLPFK